METIDVLEDYLKEFRKLVNDRLVTNDESKDKNIKDLFGLKTVEDWILRSVQIAQSVIFCGLVLMVLRSTKMRERNS